MENTIQALGQKIRMAFLDAADGPRVMLFGPMDVDIRALQQCFRKLGQGGGPIQVDKQEFVAPFGGIRVFARCSGPMFESKQGDNRQGFFKRSDSPIQFEWTRSAEGWDYLAELIDGLVQSNAVGHQYLTRYPGEDAIVVVSKGEYSDGVLMTTVLRKNTKR
jgi:hypothetical protein